MPRLPGDKTNPRKNLDKMRPYLSSSSALVADAIQHPPVSLGATNDAALSINNQQLTLNLTARTIAAGNGLTGGGAISGNVTLDVGAGDGIDVAADSIAADVSDFAGTGLEDDGSNNLRIAAAAAGNGLTGGGGLALAVGAGTLITVGATTVGITPGANYQFIGTGAGTAAAWQNLSALAGDGLDHALGVLSVDVTDIIDTSYGLTENSNNIRINLAATSGLNFSTGALLVGAGDGINVLTNTIEVDVTDILGSGLTESNNNIDLNWETATPQDVSLTAGSAGSIAEPSRGDHRHVLNQAITPTWTGLHTFNAGIDLAGTLEFQGAQSITSTAGDLTIAPAGDLKLNPTGAQIRVMASHTLQADNYASQTTGWGISYAGGGDFRYLFADELHVKSFIADLEQALAGGQIISKSVAMLSRAFTAPAAGATATLYVWDLPSAEDMAVFETGDIVRLRTFSRASGSLTVADCWGVVTSYSNLSDKEQSWTFTRSAAPNAGTMAATTVVAADALALDYGTTGNGFYEVNAIDGAYAENSPYSQIVTWWGHPATGQAVQVRLGNLLGVTGEPEYGLYTGTGVTAQDSYIVVSDNQQIIHNLPLQLRDTNQVQRIGMDPRVGATTPMMWAGVSSVDPGFIVYGDGTVWLSTLAISEQMGDMLFSQADGLLLLGPGCAITPTSWTGTRGQVATISGAFHQEQGAWANSKALVVEPAATNLLKNPSFGGTYSSGIAPDWSAFTADGGTGTRAESTDAFKGTKSQRITKTDGGNTRYGISTTKAVSAGFVTLSYYTKALSFVAGAQVTIRAEGSVSGFIAQVRDTLTSADVNTWQLHKLSVPVVAEDLTFYISVRVADADVLIDCAQMTATAYATTYIDGDQGTGYIWNGDGTAHANTSTRAATVINLNAHAPMLNRDIVTHSLWVQARYDASDANWPCGANEAYLFDCHGTGTDRALVTFDPNTNDSFRFYTIGDYRITAANQTFKAGDWLNVVVTIDYAADSYKLYLNGALIGSSTTALSAPTTLATWRVGARYNGTQYGGWYIGEYAVFGRVLTAEEVAGLYVRGKPLVDMGAFRRPGVYVLDGEFDLRSSQTGARVQIDVTGVGGYSAATTKTFSLETDGDFFAGSNISAAGTTAFAVFANAQTYNGEAMGAGDILLGDNSATKISLLWDVSEGDVILRRGNGAGSARITLDGSADTIQVGQAAASQNNVLISGGAISIRNNITERIGLTAAGILTIKDSGGNAVITLDASAGAEITKMLAMKGADAAIAIGTTPPTSASAGTGIWIDRTGIYGLLSNTYQAKMQATDGKVIAGAGNVTLDANGITVTGGLTASAPNKYKIVYNSNTITELYFDEVPLNLYYTHLNCAAPSGKTANIELKTLDGDATENTLLLYNGGLVLGVGDIVLVSGRISTNSGTNNWALAGYTASAPGATGYVTVTINGTAYKLLAAT